MTNRPVIFLDFDGVLTAKNYTPGSFLNHAPEHYGASKPCIDRLMALLRDTNAAVVVSSNWRRFTLNGPGSTWSYNGGHYPNRLPDLYKTLGDACIGALPNGRFSKATALAMWFKRNEPIGFRRIGSKYAILDDQCRHEGYLNDAEFARHCV